MAGLCCALGLLLAGCSAQTWPGYYWQAAAGQMQLLAAAQPIPTAVQDPATPDALRQRLERSQRIRRYASECLALPDNASYSRYADLQRENAVWNVVAAPADALDLHQWCFPIVGCVGYRGYFQQADAQAQALQLRAQGLDVHVYGVPAYSTLGWFNWLGGDPLLSSFIHWPEPELAGLVFHELAHQLLFVPGDTAFNEAFATTVQRLGTAQWLRDAGTPAQQAAFARSERWRLSWQALTQSTQAELAALYAAQHTSPLTPEALLARKQAVLRDFRQHYAALRQQWRPASQPMSTNDAWARLDAWVAQANNASFASLGLYEDWVPAFTAMFQQADGDWPRFYDAVRAVAAMPSTSRQAALCAAFPPDSLPTACVRHPD
ncbi:aminopeptidase [Comamonas sp. GB3 AK4-5]|uniref:aminopeptidase n=1 Tax=Comamonas sp. GB3 AK4-5 TaxID=3231487 RepID=UPI00351E16C6